MANMTVHAHMHMYSPHVYIALGFEGLYFYSLVSHTVQTIVYNGHFFKYMHRCSTHTRTGV